MSLHGFEGQEATRKHFGMTLGRPLERKVQPVDPSVIGVIREETRAQRATRDVERSVPKHGLLHTALHFRRFGGSSLFGAVIFGVMAMVFLGLWIAKDKGRYLQHFEQQPDGLELSNGILDCKGDPKAYWWSKSAPTDFCIFS